VTGHRKEDCVVLADAIRICMHGTMFTIPQRQSRRLRVDTRDHAHHGVRWCVEGHNDRHSDETGGHVGTKSIVGEGDPQNWISVEVRRIDALLLLELDSRQRAFPNSALTRR
jgi:hypothetical protein